jgi:hypothetical protein
MGEWLLRGTAWLSLLGFAGSEWLRSSPRPQAAARARWLFTCGGLALLAHSLVAFAVRYGWSHEVAQHDTAQQTEAVTGLATDVGLYVNYAFVLLWLAEIAWWWRSPRGYRERARALERAVRAVFLFMFANGAFVFVRGPQRWVGAAALLVVLVAWYRGARAGCETWPRPKSRCRDARGTPSTTAG